MTHVVFRVGVVAAASFLPPILAQDDGASTALQLRLPRVPVHTADDDLGTPYGIWAAGDTYKVSFHDGMTFVPYLGADYPQNQPWSWRTTSVAAGGVELLEAGVAPSSWHDDFRYEYRFGAVTEAYDVLHGGLEQSFVVHRRTAPGDLVVRGAVTTALRAAEFVASHGRLTFYDETGRAITSYGEAFAIDADGRKVAISTAWSDGEIALRVPGAWLARAAFPVTVDPLLSRVIVGFGNGPAKSADIGQDDLAVSRNVMIAYTHAASRFDDDVRAVLCDVSFANSSVVFSDITTNWDSDDASCAFVGGARRWVIAWRRYFGSNPLRVSQLRCHAHASGDTTLRTNVGVLTPPAGRNDWRPDVGGVDAFAAGNHALVVFQHEDNSVSPAVGHFANTQTSELWAVRVDATTADGTFELPTRYLSNPGSDAERPAVSQMAEGGASFVWLCVGQMYRNSGSNQSWDVWASRVHGNGTWLHGFWTSRFANAGTHHQLGPRVDGQDGRFAITYATASLAGTPSKTGSIAGEAIQVERIDWSVVTSNWVTKPVAELVSSPTKDFEVGAVAYDSNDRSHFAIGYRWWFAGTGPFRTTAARVGYNGVATEGPLTLYGPPGINMTNTSCVFVGDQQRFLFAYGESGSGNNLIYGHGLDYSRGSPRGTAGYGCSPARIDWSGNQQIGAEYNRVTVNGAPAGAAHFLLASLGTVDAPVAIPGVAPGCRLLIDNGGLFLGVLDPRLGADVSWRIPLPEWLAPVTVHFQDWVFDAGVLTSTRRLSVPIIR